MAKKVVARFFASASGTVPVRDWLLSLDNADRKSIGRDIATVEFGWPVGMPTCRSLGSDLWEVRSRISDGRIARVIFVFDGGEVVLLHGFVKKTQKTPQSDIDLAVRRKRGL